MCLVKTSGNQDPTNILTSCQIKVHTSMRNGDLKRIVYVDTDLQPLQL